MKNYDWRRDVEASAMSCESALGAILLAEVMGDQESVKRFQLRAEAESDYAFDVAKANV